MIDADEDHATLSLSGSENGFEVFVEIWPDSITIFAAGAHRHFETDCSTVPEIVSEAISMIHDLLGPGTRVIEYLAGGHPYRWKIEFLNSGNWVTVDRTRLFFYRYFSIRSRRVLSNSVLPMREREMN
ncbi:hypothetical protein SAMN05421753_101485 [Planctomicrobium piriforme]|uniref:Uncharacterized protein n=1 Tax=Planctomicrobium piriforme TaxID=1576369 RepID=A0A1I3BKQ4_9PLAN|nr:hypothetical protein SAMN05421753_101485 [Planctomicrobium piriforme]